MKKRKRVEGILCLTGLLLLTGCGTQAYELTERRARSSIMRHMLFQNTMPIRRTDWCM